MGGIVVMMALDGATSLLEIVQYALAALTLAQAPQRALAVRPAPRPAPHPALLAVVVVAVSGVVTVVIVATMARVGATSRAPIVQHALGSSTVVLRPQHADELVESGNYQAAVPPHDSSFWRGLPSCGELVESGNYQAAVPPHDSSFGEVFLHVVWALARHACLFVYCFEEFFEAANRLHICSLRAQNYDMLWTQDKK